MIQGLRTTIYHVPDLARAKAFYARAFGIEPYFDEEFYVGFSVKGYELGLDPNESGVSAGPGGAVAYWGALNVDDAVQHFIGAGATLTTKVTDVGGGIRVATVADPFGNLIGLIENPGFTAE